MQTEFKTNAAKPLTIILDFNGTLVDPKFKNGFNTGLFDFAVEARSQGHVVLFKTAGISEYMFVTICGRVESELKAKNLPENFFQILGTKDEDFNERIVPLFYKNDFKHIASKLAVTKFDYVFDDDKKIDYLPENMIGQHIDPEIFIEDSPQAAMVKTLQRELAAPAPQA